MARDKSKDDMYFNCSQIHEQNYVASLYLHQQKVLTFLKESCANGSIHYSTHYQVYKLIEKKFGYPVPN